MKLTKRFISIFLVVASLLAWIPATRAQASDALPSELYLTQTRRGTCTLCSAAMMLRACAYYAGNPEWNQITENGIRPTAWLEGSGLYWTFTYTQGTTEMTVDHAYLSGVSISQLKTLLDTYPDGIVLYCGNLPHAVYLIDYVGDTFYCAETVENYSGKRITLAESWLGNQYGSQANVLKNVTAYWYIKESNVVRDCGCSATYAGTYVCTTASSDLTIRSGHGTDYSVLGYIPSGAEVYVSRATGEGTSDWAHVQYGGISGYASMKYLSLKKDLVIRGSGSVVNLSLDNQKTAELQFWTSGSYENPVSLSWSRSNTNVSCSWADMESGKFPLTITANKAGTTQLTITATDSQTGDILDKMVVDVTVGSKSYTVSYNANGGSGAPEDQLKLQGLGLTLSATVPTRLGYTFLGWSANPGATAADYLPSSGYQTDRNITFHAIWQQAATIPSTVADASFSAVVPFAGGHQSYIFTPSKTGEYTFASSGDLDSKIWIYTADGTLVDSNNNGGPGDNFLLTTVLTGGSTYFLRVRSTSVGVVNFTAVREMPYIMSQSANVAVPKDQMARVTITAQGQGLTYEWYYANAGSTRFTKTGTFTSSSYYVPMNETRNGRRIYCVITDQYGNQIRTDTVTLSLKNQLMILSQPTDSRVLPGQTAEVRVQAQGDGLRYTWYYANAGSDDFQKTNSFTTNRYYVKMNDVRDGRRVYCVITDKYGSKVQTNTVTLGKPEPVKITKQPTDVTVPAGEMAKVTVSAVGDGLTYKWYYANAGSSQFTRTGTFTSSSYYVPMNETRNGRRVYCVITDRYGNQVRSNTVTLSKEPPVKILRQPTNAAVAMGELAEVTVSAEGQGLTYEWYYANALSDTFKKTGSFTGNRYYVTMTEARNGRRVYCVITDKDGYSVQTETVVISEASTLQIVSQPTDVTVADGQEARVTVQVTGENLTYTWYYAEPDSSAFVKSDSFTTNSYYITMNEARNGRRVFCLITDAEGNAVQSATVSLNMA